MSSSTPSAGESAPEFVDSSLNALISKLRRFLNGPGVNGAIALESSFGSYRLHLPPGTWVDIDQAELSFHEAEAAARNDASVSADGLTPSSSRSIRRLRSYALPGAAQGLSACELDLSHGERLLTAQVNSMASLLITGGLHFTLEAVWPDLKTIFMPSVLAPLLLAYGIWVGYRTITVGATMATLSSRA